MPHVVIEGKLNFELIHSCFENRVIRNNNNNIIKFEDFYLNLSKDRILINTTIIKNSISQKYYIQLMKKENQLTIRLDPLTAPDEKTKDVKRSIALIAKMVLDSKINSECIVTKTNLKEFLDNKVK